MTVELTQLHLSKKKKNPNPKIHDAVPNISITAVQAGVKNDLKSHIHTGLGRHTGVIIAALSTLSHRFGER